MASNYMGIILVVAHAIASNPTSDPSYLQLGSHDSLRIR